MIPGLNDSELETILARAREAGARAAASAAVGFECEPLSTREESSEACVETSDGRLR